MLRIDPATVTIPQLHQYILGAVSPRPIAFASTVDADGIPNLSPFSFFNAVGSNPPILIFSPARSGRDNTTKNTLDNIEATKEVVINIVNYNMVNQMSLASTAYEKGVNEFVKSGLTPVPSELIKPFRVKESYVQFECVVKDIYYTGKNGGAGNIIISEIVLIHVNEDMVDSSGKLDPFKMDHVARMGGDFYCRVIPESIFVLPQPKTEIGIGVDVLPAHIRNSVILTGNNLGQLGSFLQFPTAEEIEETKRSITINSIEELHHLAKLKLETGQAWDGFKILMTRND